MKRSERAARREMRSFETLSRHPHPGPSLRQIGACYPWSMTDEQRFEQFIGLCKRMFERMEREGTRPWPDDRSEPDEEPREDDSSRKIINE